MIKQFIRKTFDIRHGELSISIAMLLYIFFIISTLLIIKPAINSLFLVELGAESLPIAYLLVALAAIATSYSYSQLTERFALKRVIQLTLAISITSLITLGLMLHLQLLSGWLLYVFYVGVAIYAVLATSQFWVLANVVFNIREAKRLFSFVGAGAITGGIFGGYLTTILAPMIGNENLMFIAAVLLLACFPILSFIWKSRVSKLTIFKKQKRLPDKEDRPFRLIKNSRHLSYLAGIIALGVVTARLIDFQFSDIAAKKIPDSEELTSFFGFWLSSFNVISLFIQLFITRKIVGVWGVGYSLLLLPILIFFSAILFFVFPELWVVILLKAADGSLKQSINKSAVELLALPIPYQLKAKTKSFIDVVVDSAATGIAGCILIFFIKGLQVPDYVITIFIMGLSLIWAYFVWQVRKEYFLSFLNNLDKLAPKSRKSTKKYSKASFLEGMKNVFETGTEKEILFMLGKTKEINDPRFTETIRALLSHPSHTVKAEALRNLYFLDNTTMDTSVVDLLQIHDENLVLAALEYLLAHATNQEQLIFDRYLNNKNQFIASAALICLAKEARNNEVLAKKYELEHRLNVKSQELEQLPIAQQIEGLEELTRLIGLADYSLGYPYILKGLKHSNDQVVINSIHAAAQTLNPYFLNPLLELLEDKRFRTTVITALVFYGQGMISWLSAKILDRKTPFEISRLLPRVIAKFQNQEAIKALFNILSHAEDLTVRLECIRSLTVLKTENPNLHFNRRLLAKIILNECKLYNHTLNAMHTQIIVHYLKRKKLKTPINEQEMKARESLMELLESRLDAGLERIFKLLELKYTQSDVQVAYQGILSAEQEKRAHAIEFLDSILNPTLRIALIPIIESTVLDTTSEEVIEAISKSKLSEYDCFAIILQQKDQKLKLAVLYLIEQKADVKYLPLLESQLQSEQSKIKSFAQKAKEAILKAG